MKREFSKLVNFTGRKDEIERLKNKFNDFSIFFIYGMRGVGKTSFIIKALENINIDRKNNKILYAKVTRNMDFKELINLLNTKYNLKINQNANIREFLEYLEKNNNYILLDNFNFCLIDHSEFIREAFDIFYNSKLIVLSSQFIEIPLSVKSDIYHYNVKKLDYIEFVKLVEKISIGQNNKKISSFWLNKIYKKTGGIPLYIKVFISLFTSYDFSINDIFEGNAFLNAINKEINYLDYEGLTQKRKEITFLLSFFNIAVNKKNFIDFFNIKEDDINFLKNHFVIEQDIDNNIKCSDMMKISILNNSDKKIITKTSKKILEFYEEKYIFSVDNFFEYITFSKSSEDYFKCCLYIKNAFENFPIDFVNNIDLNIFLEENIEYLCEFNDEIYYYNMWIQALTKEKKNIFIENVERLCDSKKRDLLLKVNSFYLNNSFKEQLKTDNLTKPEKIIIQYITIFKERELCLLQSCIINLKDFIDKSSENVSLKLLINLKALMGECYLYLMEHDKCHFVLNDIIEKYPYYDKQKLSDIYFNLSLVELSKRSKMKAYEYYRQFLYYADYDKAKTINKRIVYVILYIKIFEKKSIFGITGDKFLELENTNGFYSALLGHIYILKNDYYKAYIKIEQSLKFFKENNYYIFYNLFFLDYIVLKYIIDKDKINLKNEIESLNISDWEYMKVFAESIVNMIENKDINNIIQGLSFYNSVIIVREINRLRFIVEKNQSGSFFEINVNGVKRKIEYYEMKEYSSKKEKYNIYIDFINQEILVFGKKHDIFKKTILLKLLKLFCVNIGKELNSDEIYEKVWGRKLEDLSDLNLLRVSVHSLRKIFMDTLVNSRKTKTYMFELKNDYCIIME
ncbi:MAG: NB-ARC domain-containing protein [Candidatus Muirbacterium halophilum]|nr:NB-ARC domain-containing protein [Candidatus Muirbacterium halophilum]MCK9474355.1 NB-ARC domain-containing protein [Candidatus Muirbacterium halophilum]